MRYTYTLFLVFIFLIVFVSCSNKNEISSKDFVAITSDKQFIMEAAEMNIKEIAAGQLANDRSQLPEVKDLGKKMATEYSSLLNDIEILGKKKQIHLPEGNVHSYKHLIEKKGKEFDKEYCSWLVTEHKKAIAQFEKASADPTDPETRSWATAALPHLKLNLSDAIAFQKRIR